MSMDALQKIKLQVRRLSDDEKVHLAIYLLEQTRLGPQREAPKWRDICGLLPNMLGGQDAQEWVSQERRASDERREASLKP